MAGHRRRFLDGILPPFLTPPVCSILITEVAERFSYFGFRAILVLYFHQALGYDESQAVAYFAFVFCTAYFTPVFGAIVADSYIGRYRTILWFGLAYFVGLAVLTAGAYLPESGESSEENEGGNTNIDNNAGTDPRSNSLLLKELLTLAGLAFACIGTGGIKPCVSAFGADQVAEDDGPSTAIQKSKAHGMDCDDRGEAIHVELRHNSSVCSESSGQEHHVRSFFSFFYFGINVGAVLSIALVPIIRGHYGFGAAFLAPTIFLALAMTVFVSERKAYKHLRGDDNSFATAFKVFFLLLKEQIIAKWLVIWAYCSSCRRRRHHKLSKSELVGEQLVYVDKRANGLNGSLSNGRQIVDTNGGIVEQPSVKQSNLEDRYPKKIIEDARTVLRLAPVLSMLPVFWMLYDQQVSIHNSLLAQIILAPSLHNRFTCDHAHINTGKRLDTASHQDEATWVST